MRVMPDHFFSQVPISNWMDYMGSTMIIAALAIIGNLLWINDQAGIFALLALLFALIALIYQLTVIHRYWLATPQSTPYP